MRIQSKEFSIEQHFGIGRDIPQLGDVNELPAESFTSEMCYSVMMESILLHG